MSRVLGVIPARLGSTRLPRKPLQPLLGAPLITWVWDRAMGIAALDRVIVATDAPAVRDACRPWGAEVMMTSPDHASGTDRTWEVVRRLEEPFDIIVNVQGDEPLMDADHVEKAVALVRSGHDVGTCAAPISSDESFNDPSVVKVVLRTDGSALYFSRAAIPHRREPQSAGGAGAPSIRLRHIGLYAYARHALERWVSIEPSTLEREERLEQLRALQEGLRIGVAVVADGGHGGVDTVADLARVEGLMQAQGMAPPAPRPPHGGTGPTSNDANEHTRRR